MNWLFVAIIVGATAGSDLLQSYEMKRGFQGSILKRLLQRPALSAAVALMALSFYAFLRLLQTADLSFAVPATAATLVLETILARTVLKERVSAFRWAGALLVACGVAILSL